MPVKDISACFVLYKKNTDIISLRWHYPNDVMGQDAFRLLSACKTASSPLRVLLYSCIAKNASVNLKMMLGSKGILPPTDIHELLRCYATFAILKTFGFADFP